MYILHFPTRTSVLKNGRLNERRNHEQEDNSFDLCGGYAACFRLFRVERLGDSPEQPENSADSVSESEISDSLNNGIIMSPPIPKKRRTPQCLIRIS